MRRLIDATSHGVVDYAVALAFVSAPAVLSFGPIAGPLARFVGFAYLALCLATRYPLGGMKLVPFALHGVVEAILAAWLLAAPWLYGFSGATAARNFFLCAGGGLLVLAVLTRYRPGARPYRGAERRESIIERRRRSRVVVHERRRALDDRRAAKDAGHVA